MADNSRKVQVFSSASQAVKALRRPGPYRVTRGNLAGAGVAGQVFVPAGVQGAPLVVFAHDWLTSAMRYEGLARHLASWGVVVALPSGHGGLVPNGREYAADLVAAAAGVAAVTLGSGSTTVDAGRVVLAGHGVGASCAVLAAASGQVKGLAGVAALFPAAMTPAPEQVAGDVQVPGLVVSTPVGLLPGATVAQRLGARWRPELVWLQMRDVSHRVAAETGVRDFVLGLGGLSTAKRTTLWAVLTGWVLAVAGKDRRFGVLVADGGEGLGQVAGFEPKSGAQLAAELPERLGVDEILESAQKTLRKPGKVARLVGAVKKVAKGKKKGKKKKGKKKK